MDGMSIKELGELLLAAMYEEAEILGHMNFLLSVDEIAVNVGLDDKAAVVKASRLLEEEGCIFLTTDHSGALSAFITPIGEGLVMQGGETGIIGEYRRYREISRAGGIKGMSGDYEPEAKPPVTFQPQTDHQSAKPSAGQDITHIIASMEMLVNNDPLLHEIAKKDLLVDLRTLELQIARETINKPLIDLMVGDLKKVASLSPLLDLLLSMKGI